MDSLLTHFLLFFLGSSIASFIMCGRVGGRSKCDGCGKNLSVISLVPVLSWLVQFGKSKCCEEKLSWKYLFGEVILGLWFVGCCLWFGINFINLIYNFGNTDILVNIQFILSFVLGSVFFFLVMEDLDDMSVSSRYLYLLCAVGVLGALISIYSGKNFEEIFSAIIIFSPFWLIYFLGKYLEKPMIGEADPYVFTALGIFFGTQFSISLFLYSVWLGAFLGVGYLYFINRKFERNVRIPFLPIIFLASLIILITNFHIIKIQDILIINEVLFKN